MCMYDNTYTPGHFKYDPEFVDKYNSGNIITILFLLA